jgi:hypothetical protein
LKRANRDREKVLINEIERILAETKTKIPRVRNYRKLLKEPVLHAIKVVSEMASHIPGPIELDSALWENDPVLEAFFMSPDEISRWLASRISLRNSFEQTNASELFGLLVAEYKEKIFFGAETYGEIVRRDVRKQSVSFENPRILVPAPDLEIARKELQHRILVMLFTRELNEIADQKSIKEELEKQHDLLEFKIWGNKKPESRKSTVVDGDKATEAEKILSAIDREIEDIGKNLDTPEGHLSHVTRALLRLRHHLQMDGFVLRLKGQVVIQRAVQRNFTGRIHIHGISQESRHLDADQEVIAEKILKHF